MSGASRANDPLYHVHSLHEYVLTPPSTALSRVEREQTELTAERDAFREFRERVTDIETAPVASTPRSIAAGTGRVTRSDALDLVRAAYRETVMAVPHYEGVYDEPFTEHVAAEFGPELARQLRETSSAAFTAPLRERLRVASQCAIDDRRVILDRLDEEAASVEAARSELADLLRPLSSTVIPEWHREAFVRQLDAVAERRQEELQTRGDLSGGNDHSLRAHLYGDAAWNYPVLTAVARVRETVTLGEPNDDPSSQRVRESV